MMDSAEDKMYTINKQRKYEEKLRQQEYNQLSKERLFAIIKKKLQTSFIGSIYEVEEELGFLWGDKKNKKDMTENQQKYFDIFQIMRTNILNKGNDQIRAVANELEQYTITWNANRYEFKLDVT